MDTDMSSGLRRLQRVQEQLLAKPSDPDTLREAGALLYSLGKFSEAAAHFRKAVTCHGQLSSAGCENPESQAEAMQFKFEVLMRLADSYQAVGDSHKAEKCYRAAASVKPNRAGPYLVLGTLALEEERFDEARRLFQQALDLDQDCGEAYGGLAMIHQQKGDYAAAFEAYLKCLYLDSDDLVALLGLFQASCEMGDFSKIVHYLEVYLDAHPSDASVLFCLATLYVRSGRLDDAHRALAKVVALAPDRREAKALLAELDKELAAADSRTSET